MINFENLDESTGNEIIREILNKAEGLNLIPFQGTSTYRPDLWQGYPDTGIERVLCEVKGSAVSDNDLVNRVFEQADTYINEYNPQRFFLIVLRPVAQNIKERIKNQLEKLRSNRVDIFIRDLDDIRKYIVLYPEIERKYSSEKIPWHIAFHELVNELKKFYEGNKDNPSEELFKICWENEEFKKLNSRLANSKEDFGLPNLDPIQIFASLNESSLWDARRTERLNNILMILKSETSYNRIDYTGCPAPFSIKIMAARNASIQNEIWTFFINITEKHQDGLDEQIFRKIRNWYGVQISSLTIFLFWIDSDNFLPIDKNTDKYLIKIGIYKKRPQNYLEYKVLLIKKDTDIYRRTAAYSYNHGEDPGFLNEFNKAETINDIVKPKATPLKNDANFKMVALIAFENEGSQFLKVLKSNHVFTFYQCFHLESINKIKYIESKDFDIFNIRGLDANTGNTQLDINVSAIVGKNGTGKSSLTELILMAINNLSYKVLGEKSGLEYVKDLHLHLFYHTETLYRLDINGDDIKIVSFNKIGEYYESTNDNIPLNEETLQNFFYTISINYSHFALNSSEIGEWVQGIFDKNDGYQAPIVINPFRKKGVIDINLENYFVKQRLLSNLLQPQDSSIPTFQNLRILTDNGRSAKALKIKLNKDKTEYLYKSSNGAKVDYPPIEEQKSVLKKVYSFFNIHIENENEITLTADKYIFRKLVTISKNYLKYRAYFKDNTINENNLHEYLTRLDSDPSHITYKLKQAINFLRYKHLKYHDIDKDITIDSLSNSIESVIQENFVFRKELKTIELIPPSFIEIKIILSDGSDFDKLSSGEKQKIHSVNSLIYHLTNIDSVDNNILEEDEETRDIKYSYINVLFDEAELYFHPDMQRTFLNYIRNYLKRVKFDSVNSINICFVTHSPFILSDIPSNNIVFLRKEDEKDENSKVIQVNSTQEKIFTFGANVHELLAKGFFFENGFMGDFAKEKIKSALDFLSDKLGEKEEGLKTNINKYYEENWNESKLLNFINAIGEPLIKNSLKELHTQLYKSDEDIDREIEILKKVKARRNILR
jgi:hypothetical protein